MQEWAGELGSRPDRWYLRDAISPLSEPPPACGLSAAGLAQSHRVSGPQGPAAAGYAAPDRDRRELRRVRLVHAAVRAAFVLAIALARLFRGNILASLIGTVFGNPVTFPFIASISLGFGRRILGYGASGRNFAKLHEAFEQFFAALWESILALFGQGTAHWGRLNVFMQDIFWPYLVGSILPGLACAVACYFLSRPIIAAYQARRRAVLLARTRAADAKRKKKAESDAAEKSAYIAPKNSATS